MVSRHRRSVVSFAAAAAMLVLPAISARASSGPEISHFKLANGMEVVVIPDRRTPVVTHMVWYRVGAADEPPGKSGIAHFLEHLMFKGTEKNPAGRFSKVLATIGGQENAFTSSDYTGYFQRVTRDRLRMLMEFEADRMTGLKLTDEAVLPERNVVLEEQNSRVANSPSAKLGEEVQAALFLNHPYGRPVIGWRHEIEKLDRKDALDFYNRFYTPNNAILVVAGDVAADEVKALAEETYGKVAPRAEIGPRKRPQEPEQRSVRTVTFADPRVTLPSLQRSYLVPSAATAKTGESEALEVLSQILGSGTNSRLYAKLVIEKPMATSIGAWYQSSALDQTRFGVYGTPRTGITLKDLEDGIDSVIAEIAEKGVTNDELERAKIKLVADVVYAQDSQATMARWYGGALTTGLTVEHLKTWPDRVQKVTSDQVRDAAKTWLDKRRSVTGYLVKEHAKPQERRS
ncbi:M16 family metallopeptidase [Pseudorhodoplanes sp.]|uniref:M16 family metallopeptidase n=1 Tax=Pseudorhodoplanes sp. TaxID=1934341 RepID=UPI003D102A22